MIPNRMAFYWEGGPMSWLRLQTIDTFTRLHPDWELVRIPVLEGERFKDLPLDTRSDIARWRWLAESGGWFMDTDIIWLQAIPAAWASGHVALTIDGGTVGPQGRAFSIGVVGAERGACLIGEASDGAEESASDGDHQSAGTKALAGAWSRAKPGGERFGSPAVTPIPATALYPFGHSQKGLEKAWDPEVELPEDIFGLHWSGGHATSRLMEPGVTSPWSDTSGCPVAQALRRAYA